MNGMKYIEIAEKYGVTINTVKSWKKRHSWDRKGCTQNEKGAHKNKGGQPGNKNASGPPKNKNAETHGLFSKYLPAETMELVEAAEQMSPLDILWNQISVQFAAIIRAQQIMHVKDIKDKTIEKIEERDGNVIGEKWEVQQAWDKQANFLQAQSRAMTSLNGMIKTYDELLHKNWELASDEQKARIEQLRAQTNKITGNDQETEDMDEIEGEMYGSN